MAKRPLTEDEHTRVEDAATSHWLEDKPWTELWALFELTQQTGDWNLRSITKGTMARLVQAGARDLLAREELTEDRDGWKSAAEFYLEAVLAVQAEMRALTVQLRAARHGLDDEETAELLDTQGGEGGGLSFEGAPSDVCDELFALVETLFAFRAEVARTCVDAAQEGGRADALREAHREIASLIRDDCDDC